MTRLPILRGVIRPLFPVAALGAAVAGQLELRADPHRGLVLYAVGLIALLASGAPALGGARRAWVERDARLKVRPVPLVAALLLAALAWLESGANRFTLLGVLAWVGATGSWLRAWWPGVESRGAQSLPDRPLSTDRSSRVWPLAPMLVVLLVAAFFRFHGLQQLPPEMTSDHAEKLFDVRDVLAGVHRIFFPRNTGREPAQFYLTALLAGPLGFGLNHMALKTGTAIIGWLTVPLTYAAARRGAGASRSVALIAAALLAVSKWHTEITRVGLRFPYAPFAVALLLIFLLRALRSNDRRDWLLSGLALGLGLYGYTAFRIAPLLVLVALALWWWRGVWRGGASARAALLDSALVPLTAAIAFLPLGHFALQHPEIFWYRSYTRAAEGLTGNPWSIFWHNVWNAALMFHWRGDVVWVNTVPRDPVLDPLTGALFLLGIGFLIVRVVRQRRPAEILLLVGLPILVLPSILALAWPGENPSVVRAGGALPVGMLIAAWPLAALARVLAESVRRPVGRGLAAVLVGGILIAAAGLNWWTYSVDYRESYDFNSWNTTEVAAVIRQWAPSIGGAEHAYVKSFPYWVDTRNVAFNLGDPDWNSVIMDIRQVKVGNGEGPEPRLIIVNLRDRTAFLTLQRLWSGGEYYRYKSRVPGKEFWVFVHPGYPRPASLNPGTLGR